MVGVDHALHHGLVPDIDAFLDCQLDLVVEFAPAENALVQLSDVSFQLLLPGFRFSSRLCLQLIVFSQSLAGFIDIREVFGLTLLLQEVFVIDSDTVE